MFTLTIEIETDNAAFAENPEAEIQHLLHHVIRRLDVCGLDTEGILQDANGNTVGHWYSLSEEG